MYEHETFRTPIPFLRSFFSRDVITDHEKFNQTNLLDAGSNDGRFGHYAAKLFNASKLSGVEIKLMAKPNSFNNWYSPQNYLNWNTAEKFGCIVSNPPFTLAEDFIRKSMDLLLVGGSAFFLTRVQLLGSAKRFKGLWREVKIGHVYYCASRICFLEHKKSVDVWDYCVIRIDKDKRRSDDTTLSIFDYK